MIWIGVGDITVEIFPDLARALRAAGNERGAENVLTHMEANLEFQREPGFLASHTLDAELHALRGRAEDALDALERSEKNRSIYLLWQFYLVHNRNFDGIRNHPRYVALLERVKSEMERQRTEYRKNRAPSNQIPL